MCALIEAGGTLKGCVASIVDYCKRDIGTSGEISEDDFRACIKDYYRLPEAKALAPMEKTPVPIKSRPEKMMEPTHATPAKPKPTHKEPTILSTQLDLFGRMEPTHDT